MALTEQLVGHLGAERLRTAELSSDHDALEALLAAQLAAARAAWPTVVTTDAALLEYVAARLPPEGSVASALTGLRVSDLHLAAGCVRGDPAALRAIEDGPLAEVGRAMARSTLKVPLDDLLQTVRRQLFVSVDGAAPRIADYRGTGDLRAWLRVTATRAALRMRRQDRQHVPLDDDMLTQMPAAGADLELEFVKRQYRAGFKRAFLDALGTLPARDQNLLRQHFLDDLSIDQLGALYKVHRSTAARWIVQAQETLFVRTKRALMQQMQISRSECDSLIQLVQSQFHVTLRTLAAALA